MRPTFVPTLDQRVRTRPAGEAVARLVRTHGWDAAEQRRWWLDRRSLNDLVCRVRRGQPPRGERPGRVPGRP